MKDFNINDSSDELVFSSVNQFARQCKFSNCTHRSEPGCAVIEAMNSGDLSEDYLTRYNKLIKANIFHKDKIKYNQQWRNFTVQLSKSSKRKSAYKKNEIDTLDQETVQLQEELHINREEEL
ncbi:MAG: putative GTPase related to EngC [Herbinix sp.]|jgi:ribosome biogenesis GTPase|nr:putative GTPase related to EngC [Herbinix sp.]